MKEVHAGPVTGGITDRNNPEAPLLIRAERWDSLNFSIKGFNTLKVAPSRPITKTLPVTKIYPPENLVSQLLILPFY
jgi:hypothetical protein